MWNKYAKSMESVQNTILNYEQYENKRTEDFERMTYGMHFWSRKW